MAHANAAPLTNETVRDADDQKATAFHAARAKRYARLTLVELNLVVVSVKTAQESGVEHAIADTGDCLDSTAKGYDTALRCAFAASQATRRAAQPYSREAEAARRESAGAAQTALRQLFAAQAAAIVAADMVTSARTVSLERYLARHQRETRFGQATGHEVADCAGVGDIPCGIGTVLRASDGWPQCTRCSGEALALA